MMNLLRRRALMIAAQQNTVPVWDGVTVTTPALVDGYYQIVDGATLAGFKTLAVHNKKGKLISDIILNANHENYLTWDTTPPANDWNIPTTPNVDVMEMNGNGHTIYGFYSSQNKSLFGLTNQSVSNLIHHLRVKNFTYKTSYTGSLLVLPLGDSMNPDVANAIHNVEMIGYMRTVSELGYFGPFVHEIGASKCIHSCMSRVKIYNSTSSSYSCGGVFGNGSQSSSAWNCGFMGSINVNAQSGNGLIGGLSAKNDSNPGVSNNCFCSASLTNRNYSAGIAAIHPSVIGLNCHYDSTLIPASYGGNTGCTGHPTEYFYTQEFIDELNSTLPTGCTPWKLGTDNYPTLDF